MAKNTTDKVRNGRATSTTRPSDSLSKETLLDMYWKMLLSRRVDERAWMIHRQGKIVFHISAIGQEAVQVATAQTIHVGIDYVVPYYRDLTLVLCTGVTPEDFMISLYGKQGEISSLARQMPSHFGAKAFNIVSTSAPVATQVVHAAGMAFAIKYRVQNGLQDPNDRTQPRVAVTSLGEGSTSQGEWHEAMNWAGVHQLPFICIVQNNHYAISVPIDKQMAVPNVADRAAAYGIEGIIVDGNDVLACYDVMHYAVQKAYRGDGPTLVEAKTYRMTPHSSDDDDRTYRERSEVDAWRDKDPLLRLATVLQERDYLTESMMEEYDKRARKIVDEAQRAAEERPYPSGEDAIAPVYAEAN
ncbi:MAG: thiamine pyrophosphate-dependent dehydrogenase E1 component subunit alpha [Anaerolineae bacterium]|nr:thiamine pyrophosphate-dependent dehydrogenase E1 component subunit alpha [Anaerolineae bacterium]